MSSSKKTKQFSEKEAFIRISSYCAFQERTQQEVRDKLYGYGLKKDVVESLISQLITENFINEERFAITFAGGKFRMKKWGRNKIRQHLQIKGLSEYCIQKSVNQIDDSEYMGCLRELIVKKLDQIPKDVNQFIRHHKISQYLIRKGYEPELVWEELKRLEP